MGMLKGSKEYKMFKDGKALTRKQSMRAYCYQCNGFEESKEDCDSNDICPLYQWSTYKHSKVSK
jgi:hypothetical protein